MGTHQDIAAELRAPTRALRALIPDQWDGFGRLHRAAVADGELDGKTKELMALAIAVVKQCDGCVVYHARGAAKRGATRGEVAEALGVALLMDGGPATVYGPRALAAFDELATSDDLEPLAPTSAITRAGDGHESDR